MIVDTVVNNGVIVSPDNTYPASIAIDKGKVVAIASEEVMPKAKKKIDAKGNYVIPGLVEPHCHIIPLAGGDLSAFQKTETQAYAYGGVTTVLHQAISPTSLTKGIRDYIDLWEQNALIDLGLTAEVRSKDNINELRQLADDFGIVGAKLQLCYKGTDLAMAHPAGASWVPDIDEGIGYLTFEEIGKLVKEGYHMLCRVHCEFVDIFARLKERAIEQSIEPSSWHDIRPSFIEEEAMQRLIYYAHLLGCPLYIVHMTIKEGVGIVRKAKAEGINVIAETLPSCLVLNVGNVDRILGKLTPPIRTEEDNKMLWDGIREGVISTVGTDHCVIRKEDKREFWSAEGALPGAETWLPIMLSEGVNKGRISLEKLVEVCCSNPAKVFGLFPKKGIIAIGSDADLTIIDLNKEAIVDNKGVYTMSDFSLYADWKLKGWPVLTMLRGNIIMEQGKVIGKPGYGRYIFGKAKA
jgi:dihydroorotase-like cyclic amidohydrolase